MESTVKVLSLKEPWASLIAFGPKRIETRSWRTRYRGPSISTPPPQGPAGATPISGSFQSFSPAGSPPAALYSAAAF